MRQNYGRYRLCYEEGLERKPTLRGTVEMRFAIESDGSMSTVTNDGSTLPDAKVIDCMLGATAGLSFPKPHADWGARPGEPVKVRAQMLLEP